MDKPRNLNIALVVIAIAQLMVVLDMAIVNIALPSIQRALHFPPPAWSGSSTLMRSRSAACCCSADAPATCSGGAACSSSGPCCSPPDPLPAGSPRRRLF